ncbi:unnamed protein product [Microthlaspi erraticum]|uniref:RING-type E3 ubiquitin transferase n=1 Tax=Microthlaspi erraticum TaxID=1685480 RepID=A0A6D2KVT9_9BRAS|nr:unnamed protein product [Microthlaspi erraticum]CAA7051480.1 unnamed protein product [Microthlaspi erraticum]CAA7061865.1 unnamed protein product [Microthlaspi erraticum]
MAQVPCDAEGVCMRCKTTPPTEESLMCGTCASPWHASCLSSLPETLASTLQWECPDCSGEDDSLPVASNDGSGVVAAIHAIEADMTLTDADKAKKKQEMMGGNIVVDEEEEKKDKGLGDDDVLATLGENLTCVFCFELPDRPVMAPCGHNFCLKCFGKWTIGQGKRTCAECRKVIPLRMVRNPRINSALVSAIRLAKAPKPAAAGAPKVHHFVRNEDRPDKAFRTERAVRNGISNASCGKIFVTIPSNHFGPIPAENDPRRNQGVLVGET